MALILLACGTLALAYVLPRSGLSAAQGTLPVLAYVACVAAKIILLAM
jgi:hypothetical protein